MILVNLGANIYYIVKDVVILDVNTVLAFGINIVLYLY
jgi:hypothetical protein